MNATEKMMAEFVDGRTDLVFELLEQGLSADATDQHGVSLIKYCAYFGDVSAIKLLLRKGDVLRSLGDDLGLGAATFHGHWRLCQFLLENGADANGASSDTAETHLHNALSHCDRVVYDRVIQVLLAYGANPNCATIPDVETGAFMRDCRTRGETPLHRAAAFGTTETIEMLLAAGAKIDARDARAETPLSWASWYVRPDPILRLLCYGDFQVRPQHRSMRANLVGDPHP